MVSVKAWESYGNTTEPRRYGEIRRAHCRYKAEKNFMARFTFGQEAMDG